MTEINLLNEELIIDGAKPTEQRYFFIEGELVASIPAQPKQVVGKFYAPVGAAFFCRHCSRLWANCPVDNHTSQVFTTSCGKCKPEHYGEVAGSVWMNWDWLWNKHLPRSVLINELRMLVRAGLFDIDEALLDKL